ncbi:AraC family transcriptional regulator [Alkaliphilus serpentinus]|uniref:AraC family transcriptional regulator n=1 Tax=Alkaliphilus serpentinus TaxID=1482731 RepID=A0A833M6Z8_9FIRM|nr:AraC family transcriptional regulator [Alkaliphilus serpentinus]KAB3525914.1 AraC family transcriptional regulator [Alkaliphilus serpentinus]
MNYYNRIQKSIDFIEENLLKDITLSLAASQAYCSLYHYHRIFHSMVGYTVKDYIRKRRLSCAAEELFNSNIKVIDIALKYQYKTHASFTRAFVDEVGISPKEYRKHKKKPYNFDRVNIYSNIYKSLLKESLVGPQIISKSEFNVIGFELRTSKTDEMDFKRIPMFWNKFFNSNLGNKIPNKIYPDTYLGYSCDFDEQGNYTYLICSEVEESTTPPRGLVKKIIPASRYATFNVKGPLPENLISTWRYVYNTWLPKSGLELIDNTDFEELNMERINKDIPEVTIYIPIK